MFFSLFTHKHTHKAYENNKRRDKEFERTQRKVGRHRSVIGWGRMAKRGSEVARREQKNRRKVDRGGRESQNERERESEREGRKMKSFYHYFNV